MIAFERANLVFVFNLHSTKSFTDYRVGVEVAGAYRVILSTDDELFGGYNRIDKNCKHLTDPLGYAGRRNFIQVCSHAYLLLNCDQVIDTVFVSLFRFTYHPELQSFSLKSTKQNDSLFSAGTN